MANPVVGRSPEEVDRALWNCILPEDKLLAFCYLMNPAPQTEKNEQKKPKQPSNLTSLWGASLLPALTNHRSPPLPFSYPLQKVNNYPSSDHTLNDNPPNYNHKKIKKHQPAHEHRQPTYRHPPRTLLLLFSSEHHLQYFLSSKYRAQT